MASSLSPFARMRAFFCCFSALSLLYIGPNLFLPPRIRSARTAVRGEKEVNHNENWKWTFRNEAHIRAGINVDMELLDLFHFFQIQSSTYS